MSKIWKKIIMQFCNCPTCQEIIRTVVQNGLLIDTMNGTKYVKKNRCASISTCFLKNKSIITAVHQKYLQSTHSKTKNTTYEIIYGLNLM